MTVGNFVVAIIISVFLVLPGGAYASPEDYDFTVDTQAVMAGEERLNVTQTVRVRNKTRAALEELELALLADRAEEVTVEYPDGTGIPFSTLNKHSRLAGKRFEFRSLLLDLPRQNTGTNATWSIEISYQIPAGWRQLDGSGTVIMPNLDAGLGGDWRLALLSPPNFPDINYGPRVEEYQKRDDRQRVVYSSARHPEPVVAASFLMRTTSRVDYSTRLHNRSLWPRTMFLIIPPELHSQRVYVEDISPQPDEVNVDRDGNVVAGYRLRPFGRINVTYSALVNSRQLRYDYRQAEPVKETPDVLRPLTTGNNYWTTQGQAGVQATGLIDPDLSSWQNAARILDFMENQVEPEESSGRKPADEVLESRSGNQLERADLLVTMLRSQGIPARLVIGYTYPTAGHDNDNTLRPWAEVYIAGSGWTTVDPDWARLFGARGYNPADRVALAAFGGESINGTTPEELITAAGDFSVSAVGDELPVLEPEINLSSVRYMLLPYLGVDIVRVVSETGYVLDEVGMNGTDVGSLAPGQQLISRQWFATAAAPPETTVEVGGETVAEAAAETRWWPAITMGGLAVMLAVLQFYRLFRIKRYEARRLKSQPR